MSDDLCCPVCGEPTDDPVVVTIAGVEQAGECGACRARRWDEEDGP